MKIIISQLTAISDHHFYLSCWSGSYLLDLPCDLFPLDQSAEDCVFTVQMTALRKSDKKLGVICVGASVGHRKQEWF